MTPSKTRTPRSKTPASLTIVSLVNPKTLSVNIHYKGRCNTVHHSVREQMVVLAADTKRALEATEWSIPKGPVGITLEYTFDNLRGDGDNPIKRSIDAITEALGFDDSKIAEYHVFRHVGKIPGIRATVYETVWPEGTKPGGSYNNAPVWSNEGD